MKIQTGLKTRLIFVAVASLAIVTIFVGVNLYLAHRSNAVDARQFNPNSIMSDFVMTNKNSMSEDQIQSFLLSKNSCNDTNISKAYAFPNFQYNIRNGKFVCLAEESFSGESAAHIIWQAGQDYNINPQVLIVLLQKEQGLITDTWPNNIQYQSATGYGCPDTADCSGKYYGFKNQVRNAANFFRAYQTGNTGWYKLVWPGDKYTGSWASFYYDLQVHPNLSCGTVKTLIENRATASIYSYTPYRPNQAALNAQYGSGDGCSSYGNRNFFLYFSDWFGSTHRAAVIDSPLRVGSSLSEGPFTGQPVRASFDISNPTNQEQLVNVAVIVRDKSGRNYDFPLRSISVPAGGISTYSEAQTFSQEDVYTFSIVGYVNGSWDSSFPETANTNNTRTSSLPVQAMPLITSKPLISPTRVGGVSEISFTVTNISSNPVSIGGVAVALKDPDGKNVDLPLISAGMLEPGGQFTYLKRFTPAKSGRYSGSIISTRDVGTTWNGTKFPGLAKDITDRSITFTVQPNPTITQGPTLSISSPRAGQSTSGMFTIKNHTDNKVDIGGVAIAIRGPNGNNDMPLQFITLQPGQEYTYSFTKQFSVPGTYTAWITSLRGGNWDDTSYPALESTSVSRKITFTVQN